ncbi:MAG: GlmU family protein [Bacteroidales bacterium]|nr:GlmU family protein [Lentimicrobiaceae bacterium]MDD5694732.1 GlmU family protein [Bacteroidales bacterium]
MNFILFDDSRRENLLPLTFIRPIADIRLGILTIREKWERYLGVKTSTLTEDYLNQKYPLVREENNILINGSVLPDRGLVDRIMTLKSNQALVEQDGIIAMHLTDAEIDNVQEAECEEIDYTECFLGIRNVWDLFSLHDAAIKADYDLITAGRKSISSDETNTLFHKEKIFIEEGAQVHCSVLNASAGPIYIGKDAEIMEGCLIRGPFAMCDHAVLKMGTRIFGPVTLGLHSKAGGEIDNSIIFSYSNKAHDGYLGHAIIGEWCNLGAATNNSNLKNTYEKVRMWSYTEESFVETGLQFCGLVMGDYSKTGIGTMFNTGTVVGVNTNIYGHGLQRNFIPSFSWGGTTGFKEYKIDQAIKVAERMHLRRGLEFTDVEQDILRTVYNVSYRYKKAY